MNLEPFMEVSRLRQKYSAAYYQLLAAGHLAAGKSAILMLLGPFLFALPTAAYQSLRHSQEYRWASQPRIGRRPVRQYIGPGEESMELTGFVLPEWNGGRHQLAALREIGMLGEAMVMVDGQGFFWGKWCLEEVEETGSVFRSNGAPRRIDFRLRLTRYGDD